MQPTLSPFKSVRGLRRILNAWRYSLQGLAAATRHEAAFRQELVLAAVLLPAAFFVGRTMMERLVLLATVFVVLIAELLNSAVETLADAVSVEHHPLIGRAKDIGSAAVLLAMTLLGLVWAVVLWDRFV